MKSNLNFNTWGTLPLLLHGLCLLIFIIHIQPIKFLLGEMIYGDWELRYGFMT